MKEIKYSPKTDIDIANLHDIVPERLIRVFPYELVNSNKSKTFMEGNAVSIASISQDSLDFNDEHLKTEWGYTDHQGVYHRVESEDFTYVNNDPDSFPQYKDEDGVDWVLTSSKYFAIFAAITSDGVLDMSAQTSVYGQELKEEDSFTAISNWYYEGELESIKFGNLRFMPAVFSIGRPFSEPDYADGKQAMFISVGMTEAREGQSQYILEEMNPEGLYEFQLLNMTNIESSFTNSRIIFTTNVDFYKNTKSFPSQKNGISLSFESHTLLHAIKGKGKSAEIIGGAEQTSEFGDIEFISNEPLAPFKMTPISTQDKLSMYADWFDYDSVLPFVYAEKFKNSGQLDSVITVEEDRKLVEDMLTVSDGFANSWADAPRDTSGDNAGKIKPDFRIGWTGLKVQALEGQDPMKVVDGLYEKHIRQYPEFPQTPSRYQPVREILNALSRYIYSSYCIGKGQNAFNEAYLPWFLYPTSKIVTKAETIPNPDYGGGADVTTYVLDTNNFGFKILSNFFREKYSDDIDLTKGGDLILPKSVNLSNIKMMQTDRKLALPELPDVMPAINKLPLPGDIDTQSSQDLAYIFHLPIQDQTIFEEFMLNSLVAKGTTAVGTDVQFTLNIEGITNGVGVDGKVWTQAEVNGVTTRQQPGAIKSPASISKPVKTFTTTIDHSRRTYNVGGTVVLNANYNLRKETYTESELRAAIQKAFGYEDLNSIIITSNTIRDRTYSIAGSKEGSLEGSMTYTVSHSEFTQPIVTITSANTSKVFSINGREILFDKEQWQSWISDFGIIPTGDRTYSLLHKKDVQHQTEFLIKELDEIIIYSIWGNYVDFKTGPGPLDVIRIPLFNKDDETIGVQRILFT